MVRGITGRIKRRFEIRRARVHPRLEIMIFEGPSSSIWDSFRGGKWAFPGWEVVLRHLGRYASNPLIFSRAVRRSILVETVRFRLVLMGIFRHFVSFVSFPLFSVVLR